MAQRHLIEECDLNAIKNAINLIEKAQACNNPDKARVESYKKAIIRILNQYK